MKLFLVTLAFVSSALAQQTDLVQSQKEVDQFLLDHEVSSTVTYCRTDIKTPECRMLMRYKNKASGKVVNSFQMAFTAPFRQAAGTELFLETTTAGQFLRLIDSTIDKKVNIDAGGNNETVVMTGSSIVIKGIKFGAITGDLSFDEDNAMLIGESVSAQDPAVKTPVKLVYTLLKPLTMN